MKLSKEQKLVLLATWEDDGGTRSESMQAVIDLYESEMRPKDAAPVMPGPKDLTFPQAMQALSDGKKVRNRTWHRKQYWIQRDSEGEICDTDGDVPEIEINPMQVSGKWEVVEDIPADPTPEEKAEAEFEALGKIEGLDLSKTPGGSWRNGRTNDVYMGFMAAKFPAEGGGK